MSKPNCYDCVHRRDIPGDTHSRCAHPTIPKPEPLDKALAIMGRPGTFAVKSARDLNVTANRHGILRGWFNWPLNFDPTWLENCEGFTARLKPEVK